MSRELLFDFTPEVAALGVVGGYFVISGMQNAEHNRAFAELRDASVAGLVARLGEGVPGTDPVLLGFRELHQTVGASNRRFVASPENLLRTIAATGVLPSVNLIVDIYNLVSVETRLALGAHDVLGIDGDVHLRMMTGSERFHPLGASETKAIRPGEYGYADDANDVICRMEVRQVEKTKVMATTTEAFYIVQGNRATAKADVDAACERVIELTQRFCGGEVRWLHPCA